MNDVYQDLVELCEITAREIGEANDKLQKAGGKVSPGDIDYLDKLTHMMKSIKTTMAMLDAEDEYGVSYANGRMGSYARKRDSMGRYASRGRSYGRSYDNGIMHELRTLMEEAPDDRTRQKFSKFISEMEQM